MSCQKKFVKIIFYLKLLNFCFCWNEYLSNNYQLNDESKKNAYQETKIVFNYIGCYRDRRESRDINDRDFSYLTKFNKSAPTVELCVQLCSQEGFKFAGIQAFDECYCGNTYGKYNQTDDTSCFFKCDQKYTCGGYNANSVYFLSDAISSNEETIESFAVEASNPCLSSPCKNSGMCITLMDDKRVSRGFLCRCTSPQDSGTFCELRDFCHFKPCLNGGTCLNMENAFRCECADGWNGFNCNQQIHSRNLAQSCLESTYECKNGGSCVLQDDEYKCECPPSYGGLYCESYDFCANNPCQNNGKCVLRSQGSFECICEPEYFGPTCEKSNPCARIVCANDGVCKPNFNNNDYACQCKGNFEGKNCEKCQEGFGGENCEPANFCSSNPCVNGICLWDSTGYRCTCSEGWEGENCTEKNCLLEFCLNDGLCKAAFDSQIKETKYSCICLNGHFGKKCEQKFAEVDPCLSSPCRADEECVKTVGRITSYKCILLYNFCEQMKPCNNNSQCVYSKENNTFYCKCLNGAAECESPNRNGTIVSLKDEPPRSPPLNNNSADKGRTTTEDIKNQSNEFKFNTDNLYWIVPLGLVAFVVIFFISVVSFFGFKTRNQSANFFEKPNNSQNINYLNDSMSIDYMNEHLRQIAAGGSSSSLSYEGYAYNNRAIEGYGRV